MRHRFHSICPYFAMFPETFVEKHLAASSHAGVVFDPFCGRGTTVFQALLQGRTAGGSDVNPVAVCISGAKCDSPQQSEIHARLTELRNGFRPTAKPDWNHTHDAFFALCFHRDTLKQILYLRSLLEWRKRKDDRFIAALCLGALHGESHRSPNYFSNRMPRTISTKPGYSVRWWERNRYLPPKRDVFEIIERMIDYRFRTKPPGRTASVIESDARRISEALPSLKGRVTDVITSPPYMDTTNYREDQWLRLWFLGGSPLTTFDRRDDRHYCKRSYWEFLQDSWRGLAPSLAQEVRIVVRIGGRRLTKSELRDGLLQSLSVGTNRSVSLIDTGISSRIENTQANTFRGTKISQLTEHDFAFTM